MLLKIESIPNSQLEAITTFFQDLGKVPTIANIKKLAVSCFEFELEHMHGFLQAIPDLKRRPWMFDATDEVIECEASNRLSNGNIELWWSFNDLQKHELTVEISPEQMADLLDDCNFAEIFHGGLQVSECVGRNYDGSEIWQDTVVSVYDWIEANGQNRENITKHFTAYLLRFGGEWLKEIAVNIKEQTTI